MKTVIIDIDSLRAGLVSGRYGISGVETHGPISQQLNDLALII